MKVSDIYGGNSLKAEDIGTSRPVVTIESVEVKRFDKGDKAVVHFRGKDKVLICNLTNWNAIVDVTGEDDSDNWAGRKIQLYVDRNVMFQGKRVPAIRVTEPPDKVSAKPVAPVDPPDESDIPFWAHELHLPRL